MADRGGGSGEPLTRPFEKVLKDVRNGFVSIWKAKNDYKVGTNPMLNENEPREIRALK
jgi:N-methylhydantoinase B/oxoprolinase/acetone carboxylase alpha subunit